jgi:hypothetical protein
VGQVDEVRARSTEEAWEQVWVSRYRIDAAEMLSSFVVPKEAGESQVLMRAFCLTLTVDCLTF